MKLLQFRIWGGKVEYNHPMYIWASDADTALFGIARRIEPSVTASQWTGKDIETDEVFDVLESTTLDKAVMTLRKEAYKEKKKEKKKQKKEYPCKHCEYGTYMTVEDMWWCNRYLMYAQQVAINQSNAKCLKGEYNESGKS